MHTTCKHPLEKIFLYCLGTTWEHRIKSKSWAPWDSYWKDLEKSWNRATSRKTFRAESHRVLTKPKKQYPVQHWCKEAETVHETRIQDHNRTVFHQEWNNGIRCCAEYVPGSEVFLWSSTMFVRKTPRVRIMLANSVSHATRDNEQESSKLTFSFILGYTTRLKS